MLLFVLHHIRFVQFQAEETYINKHRPEKGTGERMEKQAGERTGMGIEHLRPVGNRWSWGLELWAVMWDLGIFLLKFQSPGGKC